MSVIVKMKEPWTDPFINISVPPLWTADTTLSTLHRIAGTTGKYNNVEENSTAQHKENRTVETIEHSTKDLIHSGGRLLHGL